MSLKAQPIPPIPAETARVARAAFPNGNAWLRLHDELGTIYQDEMFAPLFPRRGQPAAAPWRLALVTIMQYAEGLSDRQAADAVRSRIDWKYLLSLELEDAGFDSSVLCEFRARLMAGQAEQTLLDTLLQVCRQQKLLGERGRQRTDSTHVLACIRVLNRLENVGTTLRHALNALAVAAPEWLRAQAPVQWVDRYSAPMDEYRLPKDTNERIALAETIGADGHHLLEAIYAPGTPAWLRQIPAVETLRRVWVQQYYLTDDQVQWRTAQEHGLAPAAARIHSPHDTEARYADKRSTSWVGYKVHLTETCDEDKPRLITQVETTVATTPDQDVLDAVHQHLAAKQLLPAQHVLDMGYVNAHEFWRSQQDYGVDLCGPPRPDTAWQARAQKGFAAGHFTFDWDRKQAHCPAGKLSQSWQETTDRYGHAQIKIKFSVRECRPCPMRADCTRIERRILTIRSRDEFLALEQARQRQQTPEYATLYAQRAGVEGSLSQAVRRCDVRRARYVGLAKTHLQHLLTAAAINIVRVIHWLAQVPLAKTRRSSFANLMRLEPLPC